MRIFKTKDSFTVNNHSLKSVAQSYILPTLTPGTIYNLYVVRKKTLIYNPIYNILELYNVLVQS